MRLPRRDAKESGVKIAQIRNLSGAARQTKKSFLNERDSRKHMGHNKNSIIHRGKKRLAFLTRCPSSVIFCHHIKAFVKVFRKFTDGGTFWESSWHSTDNDIVGRRFQLDVDLPAKPHNTSLFILNLFLQSLPKGSRSVRCASFVSYSCENETKITNFIGRSRPKFF